MSHLYVRCVTQKYCAAAIVFDGYNDNPTTKDATHLRRTGDCVGVTVHFASGMMVESKKDEFLNSKANKQRFIHYLSDNLERAECTVDHAKDDRADSCRVCQAQIDCTDWRRQRLAGPSITSYRNGRTRGIPEIRAQEIRTTEQIWCIRQFKQLLGPDVCDHILFIHAILGCDVTSRLFGLGKGLAVKRINSDFQFCQQAKVFNQIGQAKEDKLWHGKERWYHCTVVRKRKD